MEFQTHRRLIEYLPEFLREFREYKMIFLAGQTEVDGIQLRMSDLLSDMFIDSATEEGIAHRERMYGITPPESASLEARRAVVKVKETQALPYTIRRYREILTSMCGEGNFEINLNHDDYTLEIRVRAVHENVKDDLAIVQAVGNLTREIIPANLVFICAELFREHQVFGELYAGAASTIKRRYRVPMVEIPRKREVQDTFYTGAAATIRRYYEVKEEN